MSTGLSFPRETPCLSTEAIWREKKREEPPPAQRKTKLIIKLGPLQAAGKSHIQIMVACFCRDLCEHFLKLQVTWILTVFSSMTVFERLPILREYLVEPSPFHMVS